MRALFVTRAAEADLLEIWSYLFEKSEQAADRVVDEITEKYDLLSILSWDADGQSSEAVIEALPLDAM